jgi:hypothetical protein
MAEKLFVKFHSSWIARAILAIHELTKLSNSSQVLSVPLRSLGEVDTRQENLKQRVACGTCRRQVALLRETWNPTIGPDFQ